MGLEGRMTEPITFTEGEAAKRLCCVFDRNCEASQCMGWRWHTTREKRDDHLQKQKLPRETWQGYCGRAGTQ